MAKFDVYVGTTVFEQFQSELADKVFKCEVRMDGRTIFLSSCFPYTTKTLVCAAENVRERLLSKGNTACEYSLASGSLMRGRDQREEEWEELSESELDLFSRLVAGG